MNLTEPRQRRFVVTILLACLGSALLLGREAVPWAVGLASLTTAVSLALTWYDTRGPGALVQGLVATWTDLPGATRRGHSVFVHDGESPLQVRLSHRRGVMRAIVQTQAPLRTVALRAWPSSKPAPPMERSGLPAGGPPVERAALLETLFAGQVRIEANDESGARDLLAGAVTAALLVVIDEMPEAFAGLTYDGEITGVHLEGPIVADPDRATRLARVVWRAFVDA